MGGQRFEVLVPIINGNTAEAAFKHASDEALYDFGHAGYTGSIAEKLGFEMRQTEPVLEKEVSEWAYDDGMDNSKWGNAYCVTVCKEVEGPITGHYFYGWASS